MFWSIEDEIIFIYNTGMIKDYTLRIKESKKIIYLITDEKLESYIDNLMEEQMYNFKNYLNEIENRDNAVFNIVQDIVETIKNDVIDMIEEDILNNEKEIEFKINNHVYDFKRFICMIAEKVEEKIINLAQ